LGKRHKEKITLTGKAEKNYKLPEGKPKMGFAGVTYLKRQRVQDALETKIGANRCKRVNAEVQWNNTKKCELYISNLFGTVEMRARKSWITQELISKTDKRSKKKNVNNETRKEGPQKTEERTEKSHKKTNHRILKNRTL
jgi:hypothetical protein